MDRKQPKTILNERHSPAHKAADNESTVAGDLDSHCDLNFLLRNYISNIDNKFKGKSLGDLLNEWETDLLLNELQTQQNTGTL